MGTSWRSCAHEDVLYALRDQMLIIFDRFWQHNSGYSYPEKLRVYRQYQIYLNFNTISKSMIMLSRWVFKLAIAGCPIISAPSLVMANVFDESVISISNGTEVREWCVQLQKMFNKETHWVSKPRR